jgi:hypothetical protein
VFPIHVEAIINTFRTSFLSGSPINYNIQFCFLITTWKDIFKGRNCKCARIWKEFFSTRSGILLFMMDIEAIELDVLTFVITEEIDGNQQTSVGWANPHDLVSPTTLKDQSE